MKRTRRSLRVLAATLPLAFAIAACARHVEAPAPAAAAPGVVRFEPGAPQLAWLGVDTVGPRHERVVATLPAEVVLDEDHTVRVSTPVTGRVTAVLAQPGDRVAAGQPLARIASSDLAQAQSDLVKAQAAARQTAAALTRAGDLFAHSVIARKDLEQAESDDRQARAELERAQHRATLLGAASDAIGQEFVLRAPLRGEVVARDANAGAEVRADASPVLFTVSALDTVWLSVRAFQRDLPAVRAGDRVLFTTDALPGRRFEARVTRVSDALDPQTRTAVLRAVLPNPRGLLRAQLIGEARVLARADGERPAVPTHALVTHGAETVVFVETGPGRFVRRPVVVGEDDGETAEIASGLRAGERVVTRGSLLLASEAQASR